VIIAHLVDAALAAVLLVSMPGVQPKSTAARAALSVRAVRRVVLDDKTVGKAIQVRTARNLLTEVSGRFLRAFREPHSCSRKGGRVRNEDVVLEVTELCYFGREVIIAFTVENRGRVALDLGQVEVNGGVHQREYLSKRTVGFQEVSDGVVSVRLPEGGASPGVFGLTVRESAGKQRSVTVGGLEF
jgi:hypothetical protein